MTVPITLDPGAYIPTKAYDNDAGFDLKTREDFTVPAGGSYTTDTGVHIALPDGYCGLAVELKVVEELDDTERSDRGFGSSGK